LLGLFFERSTYIRRQAAKSFNEQREKDSMPQDMTRLVRRIHLVQPKWNFLSRIISTVQTPGTVLSLLFNKEEIKK